MEQRTIPTSTTLTPEQEDRLYDALNMLVRYLLKNLPPTDQEVRNVVNTQNKVGSMQEPDVVINIA